LSFEEAAPQGVVVSCALHFIRTRMTADARKCAKNAVPQHFLNESSGNTDHDRFVKNNSSAAADESVDGSSRREKNSPL
jgi:hypothetical protein